MKTSSTVVVAEGKMKRLIVGLVAGAFAATAFAATIQTSADRAQRNAVSSITQQEAEGADMSPWAAGMAANRDKALRGQPRVLTSTKEKQDVVASITAASIQSINVGARSAGINAVKDRAMKDEPKALTTNRQRQEVVQEMTQENAHDH